MKDVCSRLIAFCVCTILFGKLSTATKNKPKSVHTLLDAKWLHTPLVLEASEYLADENPEFFWVYIDIVSKYDADTLKQKTEKEYHDFVVTETSKIISAPKMALLKLSLSLRIYSPKVEMFHQIGLSKKPSSNCDAFVDVNGMVTCNSDELQGLIETASERNKSESYEEDHHYPGGDLNPISVVFYAEVGTPSFKTFHESLKKLSREGKVDYILRHYLKNRAIKRVRLSGYGVELAIKSTEYKAQDDTKVKDETSAADTDTDDKQDEVEGFIIGKLKELHPEKSKKLDEFKNHLLESNNEMTPLKVWQLQELSLQAAQRVMSTSTDEALRLMRDISQNFPFQARSLVKTVVKEDMKNEIRKNQKMFAENLNIAPSDAALFVNGIHFDMEVADIYSILECIREEQLVMDGLHTLGVHESQLSQMLALDFQVDKQEYAVDIRDSAIRYINDLEKDRKYYNWASSITEILRPTYPGVLRTIRKNIYHLVFVVDPGAESSKDLLKLGESFYIHNAPVRIGILFTVNRSRDVDGFEDAGVALLNAFNFVAQEKTPYAGLSFITDVYASVGEAPVTSSDVIELFKQKFANEDLELIFGPDSDYDTGRKLAWEYMDRVGLPKPPQVLMNGVLLDEHSLTADLFEEVVVHEVMKHTTLVQKAVYKNEISDFQDVIDYLMSRPNVMPRLNDRILSNKGEYLDLTGRPILQTTFRKFSALSLRDMTATLIAHLKYLTARDDFSFRPVTHWVVCDLETELGRKLLWESIEQVKDSNDVRVGVIYNSPVDEMTSESHMFSKAVHVALSSVDKSLNKLFVSKILIPSNAEAILSGKKSLAEFSVKEMDTQAFEAALKELPDEFLKVHRLYCDKVLRVRPGERLIVTNGRVIGPLSGDEFFTVNDFNLLEKFSMSLYGEKLQQTFKEINDQGEQDSISDLAMRVTALIMSRKTSKVRHDVTYHSADHSVVNIPARLPGLPSFDIKAIVDPVSRGAQKLAPLLMVLHEVVNARVMLFLNSEDKLSEMPLKSFYRYVLEPQMQFLPDGSASPGPAAKFSPMPEQPLLTLRMVTPDNWLVAVVRSPYDLDNIYLKDVPSTVTSEFELEHLLLEGHCFEQSTGNPPRGLQFTLSSNSTQFIVDTIVMANLGYFQLKANPGAWDLALRYGRSADIYDIYSQDGTELPAHSNRTQAVISSFKSHIVKLKVSKKPDKLHMDLLSDDDSGAGIWNSIQSTFSNTKKKEEEEEDDKLNIFSVASGHLYERFLRIMMLSVLKHTKTPVKFWFLKNYLSPSMKDVLPHMAKKYSFEYELVHYQWPRWLHQQTEKQRTIWGYKILFLDVLFPLDVKKIIFVDADLIVRTDLKDLRDLDLGGAPYGYTPFCDSRRDMDGYRFWRSGYWATHLQGRKYHISALYVVDLKKFRRIAAGDRLRGQYQGLSQDPNSLSNLDQDLPNNMIHQVSIKSLPQEWLYCETWCDESTKSRAKTIDLCNNPKTKEPKLTSAMRIVPEWKDYDGEVKKLLDQLQAEHKISTANTPKQDSKPKTKSGKHEHGEL